MNYRRLGKTNLQISEIGFGGEWLERHEESESVALLKYAHSKGINIIVTSYSTPALSRYARISSPICRQSGAAKVCFMFGYIVRSRARERTVLPRFKSPQKRTCLSLRPPVFSKLRCKV